MDYNIYADIAKRTGGDIYIGVVGPVRTGKSTFIKRFMETLVINNITDESKRARAIDELPQSGDGKTIMTTEPKFVPNEAIRLTFDKTVANIRLIDCVGYIVEGALGHAENEKPRLVGTPWSDKEMSFRDAATMGTDKVIREHSTIGIVVTTDGSVTDIKRYEYIQAEERIAKELKKIGKPYIVILNTMTPNSPDTVSLAENLSEKYETQVVPLDIANATADEFTDVLIRVLMEFPIQSIDINFPKWLRALPKDDSIISGIIDQIRSNSGKFKKMRDYEKVYDIFNDSDILDINPDIEVDAATGIIRISYKTKPGIFYAVLSRKCGYQIGDEHELMNYVVKASKVCIEYEKIKDAIEEVNRSGYGIVNPTMDQLEFNEPELVKKGSQFGVSLKANAPSLHIIRVDVQTEVSPTIGGEQQSEELVKYLMSEFENNRQSIWSTNMFGKSLSDLVREDMTAKINGMPVDVQKKIRKTMTRIVNENKGGILCILL